MTDAHPGTHLAVRIDPDPITFTRGLIVALPAIPIIGALISWATGSFLPIAIALIAFVGLGLAVWPRLKLHRLWGRPLLHVESESLRLGEAIPFAFEQTSRRPVDVSTASLHFQLTCQERVEWVTHRNGERETESETRTVARREWTYRVEATPTGLRAVGTFAIPTDGGAPSLRLDNHQISWRLKAQLDGRGLPAGTESFDVTVIPAYAPPPIQDTIGR